MSDLGNFLKQLRGDLSLREAARRSGLSYSYISSLEAGKHPKTGVPINPSPDSLKGLAKAYNYDFNDLMKKAGYIKEDVTGNEEDNELSRKKKEIMRIINNSNDIREVDLTLEVIKKMLNK